MRLRLRSRPKIEFVTDNDRVREFFSPVPAAQAMPEWFRHMRPFREDRSVQSVRIRKDATVKMCPGINDYLSLGYILPLWADHLITATDEGFAYDVDYPQTGTLATFDPAQITTWGTAHSHVLKVHCPWEIRASQGWSLLLIEPWYHKEARWSVMPGVVDADFYGTLNFVATWHLPVGETALLKAGTPLLHIIPFQRSRVDLSVVCDADRMADIANRGLQTTGPTCTRFATGVYRERQKSAQEAQR